MSELSEERLAEVKAQAQGSRHAGSCCFLVGQPGHVHPPSAYIDAPTVVALVEEVERLRGAVARVEATLESVEAGFPARRTEAAHGRVEVWRSVWAALRDGDAQ